MVTTSTNGHVIDLEASDVFGQRARRVRGENGTLVGEMLRELVPVMGLPTRFDGRPLVYSARLDREERILNASERLGEALRPGDRIVLMPAIEAGCDWFERSVRPSGPTLALVRGGGFIRRR